MTTAPDAGRAPGGVAALDALAATLLAAAPELRVARTASDAEVDAVCRLRHRHIVGHGWARAEDLPDGMERDAYDARAVHVAAWRGDDLVGTVRLVPPQAGRRLPAEEDFGVDIAPRGRVMEVGRLLIAPDHRGDPAHRAWGALFGRAWVVTREHGFRVLGGAASATMVQRLRAVGLPFEVLGPARPHWGELRHPVRLDPAHGRPRWYAAAPPPGA